MKQLLVMAVLAILCSNVMAQVSPKEFYLSPKSASILSQTDFEETTRSMIRTRLLSKQIASVKKYQKRSANFYIEGDYKVYKGRIYTYDLKLASGTDVEKLDNLSADEKHYAPVICVTYKLSDRYVIQAQRALFQPPIDYLDPFATTASLALNINW